MLSQLFVCNANGLGLLLAVGTRHNGHILWVPHVALHKLPQKHATGRLSCGQSFAVRYLRNCHCNFERHVTQVSESREQDSVIQLLLADEFSDAASSSLGSVLVGLKSALLSKMRSART